MKIDRLKHLNGIYLSSHNEDTDPIIPFKMYHFVWNQNNGCAIKRAVRKHSSSYTNWNRNPSGRNTLLSFRVCRLHS